MWNNSRLPRLFGIKYPIIQSPMAGSDGPRLTAAVANAGALGSLGLSGFGPDDIAAMAAEARAATNGSINLNFLIFKTPPFDATVWARATGAAAGLYAEAEIAQPQDAGASNEVDAARLRAAIDRGPQVMSFHFALPEPPLLDEVRAAGIKVIASATSVVEARALEDAGVDAIIAQGWEAGGHRGIHRNPQALTDGAGETGTLALVPAVVDAVSVPVIAAGGIADARGIAAAFMLGAEGVQMGTAFLQCPESVVPQAHRDALAEADASDTRITRGISGRPARAIRNRLTEALAEHDDAVAPYPLQFDVIAPLRDLGRREYMALWAGQGVGLTTAEPAGELVERLACQAQALLEGA